MELKQRKKINNIPKFYNGIDSKVGFGQQYQANDLTSMIGGNAPDGSAIAGAGSSNASFNIGQTPASKWNPKGGVQAARGGISSGAVTGAINGTIGMIQGYNSMQNAVKGTDELMAYSGQRTDQTFGVNYQAQNDINKQKAMSDISKSNRDATLGMVGSGAAAGAAIGSVVPGVGTLIGGAVGAITGLFGGLFGSKKAKKDSAERCLMHNRKLILLIRLINRQLQQKALHSNIIQIMVTRMMMYYTPTEEKI